MRWQRVTGLEGDVEMVLAGRVVRAFNEHQHAAHDLAERVLDDLVIRE